MADKDNAKRLVDLKAALKVAKPKSETTLEELAALWGTSKQRFVTKRVEFVGFPDKIRVEKNVHIYLLKPCLQALIANLERNEGAATAKKRRAAAITGIDQMAADQEGNLTIAEMAKLNQMAAQVEERERDQGLYIRIADVQRDVGQVFSLMSEFYSTAPNRLDPHGRLLTPEMRQSLEKNAHDALLECFAILKAWLPTDVDSIPAREAPARARKAPTRRKPPKRAPRKVR